MMLAWRVPMVDCNLIRGARMKQIISCLAIGTCLLVAPIGTVFGANPSGTGQPNQSCGSLAAPNTPGNAASATGSAFNPSGKAGTVYAGQQTQNSKNPLSVSQYDVACFQQPP